MAELKEHGIWKDMSTPPTYDDLQKCTYLEATLKETLRLYPPASGSRYASNADETYNGYAIGNSILVSANHVMHRHPSLWKNPEEFRPERFLDGSEGDNLSRKFNPFSRGKRDCIGKHFALLEGKIAVSTIVSMYDFECVDPSERQVARLTNVPLNGARVRFAKKRGLRRVEAV